MENFDASLKCALLKTRCVGILCMKTVLIEFIKVVYT